MKMLTTDDSPTAAIFDQRRWRRVTIPGEGDPAFKLHFNYGCCRSGRRFFWWAGSFINGSELHGRADTEDAAARQVWNALRQLADGRAAEASCYHGRARSRLKDLNAAKRPHPSKLKPLGYLYAVTGYTSDQTNEYVRIHRRFKIIKRTAKRVYYIVRSEWIDEHGEPEPGQRRLPSDEEEIGFVSREQLEANGCACNKGRHWSAADRYLFPSLAAALEGR
jgi:hypothetical protein